MLHLNFNYLLIGDCTVVHNSEVVRAKEVSQGLHATGLQSGVSDANLREGTSNYIRDGEEAPSPAEALLPTFEGKVDFQPPAERTQGMSIEKDAGTEAQDKVGGSSAGENGENSSTASETYYQTSDARSKNLNAKPSQSFWTVPTPKPKYDADSFEDPVCDRFWKGIWVACATHNVGVLFDSPKLNLPPTTKFHIRPRSIVVFFALYQTTSLPRGSITRTL
jgi:phospholipase D1/2